MDTKRTAERKSAVFILSHGRADKILTLNTLNKCHYTGKVYILIDDQDPQADEYKRLYGESVIVFCKKKFFENYDTGDFDGPQDVVFAARNAAWEFAKKFGLTHFIEFDDDYLTFGYRIGKQGLLTEKTIKNADYVFNAIFDFLDSSGADCVALAQGGDMIGGINGSKHKQQLIRKAMNTFFFRTDRPYYFYGRVNEDVNTYVLGNQQGKLIFTLCMLNIQQPRTQQNNGGMTTTYIKYGTYLKSIYSVMFCPSAVKIALLGKKDSKRIHHNINWDHTAPKILDQRCCHHDIGDNL